MMGGNGFQMGERYLLGVTISVHDSSACLVEDGRLLVAIEEERLTRKKHSGEFPLRAIEYCLESRGITVADLSCIAYSQVPWLSLPSKAWYVLTRLPRSWDFLKREIYWHLLNYGHVKTWPQRLDPRRVGLLKKDPKVLFVKHHLTHVASAYFPSPFEEASLLSIDQRGEWSSTFFGWATGNRVERIGEVYYPNSMGLFYLMLTLYLGFNYHEEYEVMGLAAYGKARYLKQMEQIIRYEGDMRFSVNERYLSDHFKTLYSNALVELLGSSRHKDDPIDERHCDIAASLQVTTEQIVFALLRDLYASTKIDKLCMAGGVALNSVLNGKITEATPFREVFIQPAAYDAGGSVGAAMYAYHVMMGGRNRWMMDHAYLGPEYSREQIKQLLDSYGLRYTELDNIEVEAARLLAEGKVIGWFQGRMEFGPRALGNRSILADPRKPDMKDRVNLLVKERQSFRPFAPAVLEEKVKDYFLGVEASPFMLLVGKVRDEVRSRIPAVVHVDGTARVQTVSKVTNPKFWYLIHAFDKIAGVPVVLNTSFNIKGEPIVCSPRDAIRCFYSSGLDCLLMDNFLVRK